MRDTDFSSYRERYIRLTDRTNTFDEALACSVQIVEREGFTEPVVDIHPVWVFDADQDNELYFEVVVASSRLD